LLDDLERVLHALHDVELLHRHPALVEEREGEAAPHERGALVRLDVGLDAACGT
jgi:hypothetical protein